MPTLFTEHDTPDQTGRIAIVTGANTGIGFHIARVLAERGARVLLGCRSAAKAEGAIKKIKDTAPHADIKHLPLDLADLDSVRAAATIAQQEEKLDLLINNAGIMMPPKEFTADGFESQFGVNHLGPFAFTGLLLEKIKDQPSARIVSTSSIAHRNGVIDFDDINADASYSAVKRYQMSKLANLLFAFELDRRLRATDAQAISVGCHPGVADTDLPRHLPKLLMLVMSPLIRPFFNTAAQGAWPALMAASADGVEGGEYFGPSKRGETAGPAARGYARSRARNEETAKKLWALSIEMTGIDPGI